jgi:hypothetical protein
MERERPGISWVYCITDIRVTKFALCYRRQASSQCWNKHRPDFVVASMYCGGELCSTTAFTTYDLGIGVIITLKGEQGCRVDIRVDTTQQNYYV